MTKKYPALLCKIIVLLSFLTLSTNASAQLDVTIAKTITGFNNIEETPSIAEANDNLILFSDYGSGKLTNGKAEIFISPEIANQIEGSRIEERINVSIQMEGRSEGVYVSKKDTHTFVIAELNNGTSTADFTYRFIVTDSE
jgi:hypothetical protein